MLTRWTATMPKPAMMLMTPTATTWTASTATAMTATISRTTRNSKMTTNSTRMIAAIDSISTWSCAISSSPSAMKRWSRISARRCANLTMTIAVTALSSVS